jgi:hypothetical protein
MRPGYRELSPWRRDLYRHDGQRGRRTPARHRLCKCRQLRQRMNLDAELVRLVRFALADALDLGSVQAVGPRGRAGRVPDRAPAVPGSAGRPSVKLVRGENSRLAIETARRLQILKAGRNDSYPR